MTDGEPDEALVGVEGTQDEATDALRAGHRGDGHEVAVFGDSPSSALQLLTSAELFGAADITYGYHRSRRGLSHGGSIARLCAPKPLRFPPRGSEAESYTLVG